MLLLFCFLFALLCAVSIQCFHFHHPFPLQTSTSSRRSISTSKTYTTKKLLQNRDNNNDNESQSPNTLQQLSLTFDCDEIDSDTISEFLFELGSLSVSCEVEEERKSPLEEKKWSDIVKTKNWQIALLKANFPSSFDLTSLTELIQQTYPEIHFEFTVGYVEDRDWISHVQSSWKPMVVGDLMLSFPWHEQQQQQLDSSSSSSSTSELKHLVLEGGAAFGTGDHPTTRLCLRWIQKAFREKVETSNPLSLLDYGCGSAILGLAGLKYGAAEAAGVDIDVDSLISARWNAERNELSMSLYLAHESEEEEGELGQGFLSSDEERSVMMNQFKGRGVGAESFPCVDDLQIRSFDILVANILAPILMHLAPQFAKYLRNTGNKIAFSGVLTSQADRVIEVYSKYFDNVKVEEEEDGWALIVGYLK